MKALILGAGFGNRLAPYTDTIPKCLLPIGNRTILEHQLHTLRAAGIDDIAMVKGYRAEQIQYPDVRYYVNQDYRSTNMVHSLFCAEDELDGEIIISYADILYERAVLDAMLRAQDQDVSVAADTEWEDYYRERFSRPLEEAESFLWNSDRKILEIGASHPSRENVQAQYIGLIRLSAAATTHIRNFYSAARARYWDREWLRGRIFQKTYMTDFLQIMKWCSSGDVPGYSVGSVRWIATLSHNHPRRISLSDLL
jgi:choline kinase